MLLLLPKAFALCRGASRRERPAFHPAIRPLTNLNHFYPVAEKAQAPKSRWTGFGSEQPEFEARNMATSESAECRERIEIPLLKVLESLEIGLQAIQF